MIFLAEKGVQALALIILPPGCNDKYYKLIRGVGLRHYCRVVQIRAKALGSWAIPHISSPETNQPLGGL